MLEAILWIILAMLLVFYCVFWICDLENQKTICNAISSAKNNRYSNR